MIASYHGIMNDVLTTVVVIAFTAFAVYFIIEIRRIRRRKND
jgi:hypothetical protein